LIIVKRLAILPPEPQVTEFQQEEPLKGRITLTRQTTSIVDKKRHQDRSRRGIGTYGGNA
jgi:hypothetical protein